MVKLIQPAQNEVAPSLQTSRNDGHQTARNDVALLLQISR